MIRCYPTRELKIDGRRLDGGWLERGGAILIAPILVGNSPIAPGLGTQEGANASPYLIGRHDERSNPESCHRESLD
jgi:hypothetical protein